MESNAFCQNLMNMYVCEKLWYDLYVCTWQKQSTKDITQNAWLNFFPLSIYLPHNTLHLRRFLFHVRAPVLVCGSCFVSRFVKNTQTTTHSYTTSEWRMKTTKKKTFHDWYIKFSSERMCQQKRFDDFKRKWLNIVYTHIRLDKHANLWPFDKNSDELTNTCKGENVSMIERFGVWAMRLEITSLRGLFFFFFFFTRYRVNFRVSNSLTGHILKGQFFCHCLLTNISLKDGKPVRFQKQRTHNVIFAVVVFAETLQSFYANLSHDVSNKGIHYSHQVFFSFVCCLLNVSRNCDNQDNINVRFL